MTRNHSGTDAPGTREKRSTQESETNSIPSIPNGLILEHVIPYLDRETYDNCIIANREIYEGSKAVSIPPWPQKCLEVGSGVCAVSFSPCGRVLACGCEDGTLRLWNNQGICKVLEGHKSDVISVVFSPNGTLLATGSRDCTIRIWSVKDFATSSCSIMLMGHVGPVHALSFSPDGEAVASAGGEQVLRLWNVSDGVCTQQFEHTQALESVASVAFSPDGLTLASVAWNGRIHLSDISSDYQIGKSTILGKGLPSSRITFSLDGRSLFSIRGYRIRRWNLANRSCTILKGHRVDRVWSVAFSPASTEKSTSTIACGDKYGMIHISTVKDDDNVTQQEQAPTLKATIEAHHQNCSMTFTPDGKTLASACVDGTIKLWNT